MNYSPLTVFFSMLKKNLEGASICVTFWKRERTNAPCALMPNQFANKVFFAVRDSTYSFFPVDADKLCKSSISVSKVFNDRVISLVKLKVYCWQKLLICIFPQSHHCCKELYKYFCCLKTSQKKLKNL